MRTHDYPIELYEVPRRYASVKAHQIALERKGDLKVINLAQR